MYTQKSRSSEKNDSTKLVYSDCYHKKEKFRFPLKLKFNNNVILLELKIFGEEQ